MPVIELGYGTVFQGNQTIATVMYEVEAVQHGGETRYTALLTLRRGSLITKLMENHLILVCYDGQRFHILRDYAVDAAGRYQVQLTPTTSTPYHD
jgi:hypothetical protein